MTRFGQVAEDRLRARRKFLLKRRMYITKRRLRLCQLVLFQLTLRKLGLQALYLCLQTLIFPLLLLLRFGRFLERTAKAHQGLTPGKPGADRLETCPQQADEGADTAKASPEVANHRVPSRDTQRCAALCRAYPGLTMPSLN